MSSKIDLSQRIFDKIEELGADKAAKFFGRTAATVKKWGAGTLTPDVGAAQKILDELMDTGQTELPVFENPPEQGRNKAEKPIEVKDHTPKVDDGVKDDTLTVGQPLKTALPSKKFSILCPAGRDLPPKAALSIFGNWKATLPEELRGMLGSLDFESDTTPHRARNILAMRFLASGNEWSFWQDDDMISSFGNAGWFKKITKSRHANQWFNRAAIERLSSRGKTLIGAVYSERGSGGRIVAQPGMNPDGEGDRKRADEIKSQGPTDELLQVRWIGFGCTAVHRKVFEDILKTQPDVAAKVEGEPHNFFNFTDSYAGGEDAAFCKRAYAAGHASFLDLSVHAAHVGRFAFMP